MRLTLIYNITHKYLCDIHLILYIYPPGPPTDTSYNSKAVWDNTNTKYTLTLAAGDVLQDTVFTCSVKIDGVWHTKTVDVDFFG